jgi:uncharacterized membrane protein
MELLSIAAVMLVMDAAWLTGNSAYHRKVFAAIQGTPLVIRAIPAAIVYVLMIGAVWFLAVRGANSWSDAAVKGGVLGLGMYGVYDMTNYATLTKYPLTFALTDMAWGTVLCATTAAVGYLSKS